MSEMFYSPSIEIWLADVRVYVRETSPKLLPMLDVYSGEARFGRRYIDRDLLRLHRGAAVLEIGAGALLLSCQLMKEGFATTALEPIGAGFSNFTELQTVVLSFAKKLGIAPEIVSDQAERFTRENAFDFAFSINVMEHVASVSMVLSNVSAAIRPGGRYRFTCPNYLFPYEPHFNIPTLFSKRLTGNVFRKLIVQSGLIVDPVNLWRSLNWITVPDVVRAARGISDISMRFNRNMIGDILVRAIGDKEFAARRSWWMLKLANAMVSLGLHKIMVHFPPHMQPVIDCTIKKRHAPSHGIVAHLHGERKVSA
jgi:SAM-dependent methyltransferase